jgi:hypothetical protein
MTKPHQFRDRFGPAFEASACVEGLGLNIKHGDCECGRIICAYADAETAAAFAGFVSAFHYLKDKGVVFEGLTARTRKVPT